MNTKDQPKFLVEQVALCPRDPIAAKRLLSAIGMEIWVDDTVHAAGVVRDHFAAENVADLSFNYDNTFELEVLHYQKGPNWMQRNGPSASHFGMHCSAEQLAEWTDRFNVLGIKVAQEVWTTNHENPAIAGQRWYHYKIFDTRDILGIDLKFIVRRDTPPGQSI